MADFFVLKAIFIIVVSVVHLNFIADFKFFPKSFSKSNCLLKGCRLLRKFCSVANLIFKCFAWDVCLE